MPCRRSRLNPAKLVPRPGGSFRRTVDRPVGGGTAHASCWVSGDVDRRHGGAGKQATRPWDRQRGARGDAPRPRAAPAVRRSSRRHVHPGEEDDAPTPVPLPARGSGRGATGFDAGKPVWVPPFGCQETAPAAVRRDSGAGFRRCRLGRLYSPSSPSRPPPAPRNAPRSTRQSSPEDPVGPSCPSHA